MPEKPQERESDWMLSSRLGKVAWSVLLLGMLEAGFGDGVVRALTRDERLDLVQGCARMLCGSLCDSMRTAHVSGQKARGSCLCNVGRHLTHTLQSLMKPSSKHQKACKYRENSMVQCLVVYMASNSGQQDPNKAGAMLQLSTPINTKKIAENHHSPAVTSCILYIS